MLVEMGLFAQGIAIAHTNRGLSKTQCCEAQVPDTGLVHLIRENRCSSLKGRWVSAGVVLLHTVLSCNKFNSSHGTVKVHDGDGGKSKQWQA